MAQKKITKTKITTFTLTEIISLAARVYGIFETSNMANEKVVLTLNDAKNKLDQTFNATQTKKTTKMDAEDAAVDDSYLSIAEISHAQARFKGEIGEAGQRIQSVVKRCKNPTRLTYAKAYPYYRMLLDGFNELDRHDFEVTGTAHWFDSFSSNLQIFTQKWKNQLEERTSQEVGAMATARKAWIEAFLTAVDYIYMMMKIEPNNGMETIIDQLSVLLDEMLSNKRQGTKSTTVTSSTGKEDAVKQDESEDSDNEND